METSPIPDLKLLKILHWFLIGLADVPKQAVANAVSAK